MTAIATDLTTAARAGTIGATIARSARRHPRKTALVGGDTEVSFEQLDGIADRVAAALIEQGVERGDRLALLARNCLEFVFTYLGAARAGVVVVPINFMLGPREVAFILRKSGAVACVAESALAGVAEEALEAGNLHAQVAVRATIGGERAGWEPVERWWTGSGVPGPAIAVDAGDPLELLFTSGTESQPKGVALTHHAVVAQHTSCIVGGEMQGDDIEVHAMPLYHCAQLHCFLTVDLHLGATSVILPGADPASMLAAVERHRATKLFCPPTVWIDLMRHPDWERRDLSSLRKAYYGASVMPIEVLRRLREQLPGVRLFNFYGQTEIAPLATILGPEDQERKAGSAGRPAINVETAVVDDDDRPLPAGEVGEIVHRSPQLTSGYWDEPEQTAEAFRGGWFHSGDLGVFDEDGYLTIVDRKKDMIKSGGENVASREVEELLYSNQAVAEAAVFGIPHERWIEAVAAAVVLHEGERVTADELREHVRARAAHFKAPKFVVLTDRLPKNASGKILKRQLRKTYAGLADTGDGS